MSTGTLWARSCYSSRVSFAYLVCSAVVDSVLRAKLPVGSLCFRLFLIAFCATPSYVYVHRGTVTGIFLCWSSSQNTPPTILLAYCVEETYLQGSSIS